MNNSFIEIYRSPEGDVELNVKLENDTVWLSSNQMATLFNRDEKTIRKHINNIFSEQELDSDNNTQFLRVVGVKQKVAFYTLDVIISVGYRVKSVNGTKFRQWANKILKNYLIKGYAINKDLKEEPFRATYENAMLAINALKGKFGGSRWFANEKDN